MSGIPLFSGPGVINNVIARYAPANTQTQANANECDTGTNCEINSPQTQGDGTANSPTNLQISKFNEEEEQVEEPPVGAFLVSLDNCIRLVSPSPAGYTCTVVSPETLRGNAICVTALSICAFSADGSAFRC